MSSYVLFTIALVPLLAESRCLDSSQEIAEATRLGILSPQETERPEIWVFTDALATRMKASKPSERALAEAWAGKALLELGLTHPAWLIFHGIAIEAPAIESAEAKLSAIKCLLHIHDREPGLFPEIPAWALQELRQASKSKRANQIIADAALMLLFSELESESRLSVEAATLTKGVTPHEDLAIGILASYKEDADKAADRLGRFIHASLHASGIPPRLRRMLDSVKVLRGHALFTLGRFTEAAQAFHSVERKSNKLAHAFSALAWAQLEAGKPGDAIGTAIGLSSGALKRTFAPESEMVMAMALNELCQYPESLQAIALFRRHYEPSFKWLASKEAQSRGLYTMALLALERKEVSAPDKVFTEWLRAPGFISRQEEINLLIKEQRSARSLSKAGATEQFMTAQSLLADVRALRARYAKARILLKPGESIPQAIVNDLNKIELLVRRHARIARAGSAWQALEASQAKRASIRKPALISEIEKNIRQLNSQMLTTLSEIAENNQLIEVEIFQGATQDIVWKNAHPDYEKFANELAVSKARSQERGPAWDWGRALAGLEGVEEVWEDELGSFNADLYDNCGSKDRYLTLALASER